MAREDWVSVAEFSGPLPARIVAVRLTAEGVPHRVVGNVWPRRDPTTWIWVPPEWRERAQQILAEPAMSEDELTKLALSYPPSDDQ
jgi:hypothetical protein